MAVPVAVGVGVSVGEGVKVGLSVAVGTGACVAALVGMDVGLGVLVLASVSFVVGVDVPVGVFAGVAVTTTTMGVSVGSGVSKKCRMSSLVMPTNAMPATIPTDTSNPQSMSLPQPLFLLSCIIAAERVPDPPLYVAAAGVVSVERVRSLPSLQATQVHAGGCLPQLRRIYHIPYPCHGTLPIRANS